MDDFERLFEKEMKDPEFVKEWEASEIKYQLKNAFYETRKNGKITQKQLSESTGIPQADISRFERGDINPRLSILQRLADGLGMVLTLAPKQAKA